MSEIGGLDKARETPVMGKMIKVPTIEKSAAVLDQNVYKLRREIEEQFEDFCQLKSGDNVDKLKMFVFQEIAKIKIVMIEMMELVNL